MAMVVRMLKPAGAWLVVAVLVGWAAIWFAGSLQQDTPKPPPLTAKVEVPIRPVGAALADARRVTVTVRWGFPGSDGADRGQASPLQWDGYLSLDCGEIERIEPLGLEIHGAATDDRIGPVVRGIAGDQRVYWRSSTGADWDGVRTQVAICTQEGGSRSASRVRIVTPQRTYVAQLDWSVDDFVSMKVDANGHTMDVHIAAINGNRGLQGARITNALPEAPDAGKPEAQLLSEVPEAPEADPEQPL
jgi:hypothetical protein